MLQSIIEFAKSSRMRHPFAAGRVLEVGSYNVNGTIREAFSDAKEYIGIDREVGSCVDRVVHGYDIRREFEPESFDTVVCCETLEHDPQPWIIVEQMKWVLRLDGYLFVSTPTFNFPLHRHPFDCYRFGEDAYREFIFKGMEILELGEVGNGLGHSVICCLGRK